MDKYKFMDIQDSFDLEAYRAIKKYFDLNGERLSNGDVYDNYFMGDDGRPLRVYKLLFEGMNGTWEITCQFSDSNRQIVRIYNLYDFDNPITYKGEEIGFRSSIDVDVLKHDEDVLFDLLSILNISKDSWLWH